MMTNIVFWYYILLHEPRSLFRHLGLTILSNTQQQHFLLFLFIVDYLKHDRNFSQCAFICLA